MTFWGDIVALYWVYFGQGEDFKLTMELSEKNTIFPQPRNQKQLEWSNTQLTSILGFYVTSYSKIKNYLSFWGFSCIR